MALSKPSPHFTLFHNHENPPVDRADSILTLSIDTSRRRRRRRDVLLSISGTLIPQLFFFNRKRVSSDANAVDFINFFVPQPEPERTVEVAQEGLRKNAENIKRIKEMIIEKKLWKEGGKELRRSASNMKQDFYLIIQAKPPKDRPLFRSLYSSLFNSITKMDYAARDEDDTKGKTEVVEETVMMEYDEETNQFDVEFCPVEHPVEPEEEDRPVKCPVPISSSLIHNSRVKSKPGWVKHRASCESPVYPPSRHHVRNVRKRHNSSVEGNNNNLFTRSTLRSHDDETTSRRSNVTIYRVLHQVHEFEP